MASARTTEGTRRQRRSEGPVRINGSRTWPYELDESRPRPPFAPGRTNPSDGSAPFLFISAAFLAGFSERLAQDMFARSGQGLLGSVADAPTHGPSAGLSPKPGRTGDR